MNFLVKYLDGTEEVFENVITKVNEPDSYIFHFYDQSVVMKDTNKIKEVSLYLEG